MDPTRLTHLLEQLHKGDCSVSEAFDQLKSLPYEDLGYAKVDHHRELRNGFAEVIYCAGKTPEQVQGIVQSMIREGSTILGTRASEAVYEQIRTLVPETIYKKQARCLVIAPKVKRKQVSPIAIVCAGTSDIPVAEEAAVTAETFGYTVDRIYDVGVAGLHRLLGELPRLRRAGVVIVIAGMEGALVSVVGGLVDRPVIAVPTSVGYGTSFHGITALFAMLNSCASGVTVVNIDNGFGAAYSACLMLKD
ncbi:MAG: nickel pincer cofactor biosynthesis protein LarB [Sporolactobacillus sp.]